MQKGGICKDGDTKEYIRIPNMIFPSIKTHL